MYYKDGLLWIGGRHVCAIRNGELRRTFDATRELFRGSLCFRVDVLKVAVDHGATRILATERRTKTMYRIALRTFRVKGWGYDHDAFGSQWACDLRHWQKLQPRHQARPGEARQLGLWGVAP